MAGVDYRTFLPSLGSALCEEALGEEFVALFQCRVADYVGGPRNYADVLKSFRLLRSQPERAVRRCRGALLQTVGAGEKL